MIHERDRRTDRQADGRTHRHVPHDSIDRACIASRGKNAWQHVPVCLQQFPSYSNHNCKKLSFLRTPAFIFCLPWGRPCGSHAKRCMNEKTIQCLPNTLQHVPTYLQHFPSYSNRKCKKSPFSRTAAHSQCSFSKDRCDMVKYTGYDDHLRCDVLNCLELVNDAVSHSNQ